MRHGIGFCVGAEGTTSYTYDNNKNILTVADAKGTITRQFDGLNRMTKYTDVNGKVIKYTYDANGNMTDGILNGSAANFTYDSHNRLMQAGDTAYAYDADNNRISSTVNGQTTKYVYDTQGSLSRLLVSTDSSGISTYYVYGMGLIGSQDGSGNYSNYHYDYRGSTTAITNISGSVTDRYTYGAYGNLVSHTGTSTIPFLYNGRDGVMTDSNGLYYLRSRYYSPELMRFINADTLKGTITSSVTLNRYAYANGNPVSLVDPFGTCAEPGNSMESNAHFILDIAGMIPVIDMAFDAVNGIWYASEGDWANASLSAFALAPIVGDIGGAGKVGYKTSKMGSSIGKKVMNFIQDEGGYIDLGKLLGITKNGDEVEAGLKAAGKAVRNPNGKKGGLPHQTTIDNIKSSSANGRMQSEYKYNTPNGTKSYRYADKVEIVNGEVTKIYQSGKVNKNGLPVTRESKAIEDIMNSPDYNGAPIYFMPYNSNIEPIIYLP